MFAKEIADHKDELPPIFLDLMTPAERSHLKEGHIPPLDAQLGLAARARLNKDAREPQVFKLIRAASSSSPDKDEKVASPEPEVPGQPIGTADPSSSGL